MPYTNQCLLVEHVEVATLGAASKPNRRLTGGSARFRPVSIVLNNDNRPEPDGTAGQPAVGFWSRPLTSCSMHTQVVNFHIVMEIWLEQSLHIYISTGGYWMIMMIAYWLFKLIKKSCTLWFMVDLWPIHSSLCQHEPKLISSMQATVIR